MEEKEEKTELRKKISGEINKDLNSKKKMMDIHLEGSFWDERPYFFAEDVYKLLENTYSKTFDAMDVKIHKINKKEFFENNPKYKDVKFLIDANSNEQFDIWKDFSIEGLHSTLGIMELDKNEKSVKNYIQKTSKNRLAYTRGGNQGHIWEIGTIAGNPMMVTTYLQEVSIPGKEKDSITIMFYSSDGSYYNYQAVESFINQLWGDVKYDKGTRLAQTNYSNFHHCLHFVYDYYKSKP